MEKSSVSEPLRNLVIYNKERRTSSLGMLTPDEHETLPTPILIAA
jgi:hypothetical protein